MKLSKNLSLSECTKSQTAKRLGINNEPDEQVIKNLRSVAENVFQPCRDHFDCPIYVSSGYRSPKLNTAIRGSKTSQHMSGQALDLDADVFQGITNADIFNYIKDNLEFDQLIWEFGDEDSPDWVHVSYNPYGDNRNRALKSVKIEGGGTAYKPIQ
jgi:hypothetical protein